MNWRVHVLSGRVLGQQRTGQQANSSALTGRGSIIKAMKVVGSAGHGKLWTTARNERWQHAGYKEAKEEL